MMDNLEGQETISVLKSDLRSVLQEGGDNALIKTTRISVEGIPHLEKLRLCFAAGANPHVAYSDVSLLDLARRQPTDRRGNSECIRIIEDAIKRFDAENTEDKIVVPRSQLRKVLEGRLDSLVSGGGSWPEEAREEIYASVGIYLESEERVTVLKSDLRKVLCHDVDEALIVAASVAAETGAIKTLRLCLAAGADANMGYKGCSLLSRARHYKNDACVQLLLTHGALDEPVAAPMGPSDRTKQMRHLELA